MVIVLNFIDHKRKNYTSSWFENRDTVHFQTNQSYLKYTNRLLKAQILIFV